MFRRNLAPPSSVVFLQSVRRLLVTANVVPITLILVTMMEALSSSKTSVLARATQRNIPEDTILQNLKSLNLHIANCVSNSVRQSPSLALRC
jgi:hypothetical protein